MESKTNTPELTDVRDIIVEEINKWLTIRVQNVAEYVSLIAQRKVDPRGKASTRNGLVPIDAILETSYVASVQAIERVQQLRDMLKAYDEGDIEQSTFSVDSLPKLPAVLTTPSPLGDQ